MLKIENFDQVVGFLMQLLSWIQGSITHWFTYFLIRRKNYTQKEGKGFFSVWMTSISYCWLII